MNAEPDLTVIRELEAIRGRNRCAPMDISIYEWSNWSPTVTQEFFADAAKDRAFLLDLVDKLQGTVTDLVTELQR